MACQSRASHPSRVLRSTGAEIAFGNSSSSAQVDRARESAKRNVNVLKRRPDPLHKDHDTAAGGYPIHLGDLFDLHDGFLQVPTGKGRSHLSLSREQRHALKIHLCAIVTD